MVLGIILDCSLNHCGRVGHICVSVIGRHWWTIWLVTCKVPSHYINQRRLIVNCNPRKKSKLIHFDSRKPISKCRLKNVVHFVSVKNVYSWYIIIAAVFSTPLEPAPCGKTETTITVFTIPYIPPVPINVGGKMTASYSLTIAKSMS